MRPFPEITQLINNSSSLLRSPCCCSELMEWWTKWLALIRWNDSDESSEVESAHLLLRAHLRHLRRSWSIPVMKGRYSGEETAFKNLQPRAPRNSATTNLYRLISILLWKVHLELKRDRVTRRRSVINGGIDRDTGHTSWSPLRPGRDCQMHICCLICWAAADWASSS